MTHLVHSHHHADHVGASSLFGKDVVRIGHEETDACCCATTIRPDRRPTRHFKTSRTLEIGGERIELAWHGANHSPDNIYIHFPDHDTLMLVDIVNAGWVPIYNLNLTEDVPGYIAAPGIALTYPWKHYISGHLGRLATRDDIAVHQQYIADIDERIRTCGRLDPTPFFVKYGANVWAGVKGYLDAVSHLAAHRSSRSTPACSPRQTSSQRMSRSGSWSRSGSTWATARRSIHSGRAKSGRTEVVAMTKERMDTIEQPSSEGGADDAAAFADPVGREFLRTADPTLARLIDARPDFRPRAWTAELPRLDAFGTLVFQVLGQQLSVAATRTNFGSPDSSERSADRFVPGGVARSRPRRASGQRDVEPQGRDPSSRGRPLRRWAIERRCVGEDVGRGGRGGADGKSRVSGRGPLAGS